MRERATSTALLDEHAANQHRAYMRGWLDGCSGRFLGSPTADSVGDLGDAYRSGHIDGITLRNAATRFASSTYGFTPGNRG